MAHVVGKMHAANLETSSRLQAVLAVFRQAPGGLATTKELSNRSGYFAINSIVDELRESGRRYGFTIGGGWIRMPDGCRAFQYCYIETATQVFQRELQFPGKETA